MKGSSREFEESMKRLENIVTLLEKEDVSLDEALKRYEEGIKLVRFCTKKLQESEKKIEILSLDQEGPVTKKTFSNEKAKRTTQERNVQDETKNEEFLF